MRSFIQENKYELILLAAAYLWVGVSVVISARFPVGNWFSRSGAILVLLSVIVEFRIGNLQQASNSRAAIVAGLGVPSSSDLPRLTQRLLFFAHISAILGTILWGYGDLFL
jgi:hypothetical protein